MELGLKANCVTLTVTHRPPTDSCLKTHIGTQFLKALVGDSRGVAGHFCVPEQVEAFTEAMMTW